MLNLTRPLVFLDLETTGLDRDNDRIVQIALAKLYPSSEGGDVDQYSKLVNPTIPIPVASSQIHGILDEHVRDAPAFADIAGEVFEFMAGCDLAGFNSNWFDIPLLAAEFARIGIQIHTGMFHMIDVGNLFKIREPRNLANAVRFYCDEELPNAHNAMVDCKATFAVFAAQLQRYPDLPSTVEELAVYTNYGCKAADLSGKFTYSNDGVLLLNFGRHKGHPAADFLDFVHWMYYKADFAPDTRAICEDLLGLTKAWDDATNGQLPW
ncbi:DNA polymerase-3 subunit epsilon [Spirosoma lacussanchae]|uniref:3'-5' exonuclease n=1 Tax=Spirosoma lacussanchae TaxID=1884249 RepID=UPI0011095968|nr:3'-5' exonuclease [Spirosoma lacussanchae]